jgi:sugar phosphate isomerase/epimerase
MSLVEVFEFCAKLGFTAVDPTGYYFPRYPAVPDETFLNDIKRRAFLLGLDISGTGVRNDFTQADPVKLEADVDLVRKWIECAARMGAPVLRVFSGAPLPAGGNREQVTARVVDAFRRCAEHGKKHGVIVAVQNHADFIETSDQVLDIIRRVDSEWFGLHLDIGSYRVKDAYDEVARTAPYAVNWQIKENVWFGRKEVKTDLKRLFGIIRQSGYRGYLPLETLGAGDPREKLPRFLDEVRTALA